MPGGKQSAWPMSALAAALMVGCASGPQPVGVRPATENSNDSAASVAPVAWREPAPLPASETPAAEVIPTPPQDSSQALSLTLFDAVEMALAQNPDLIALRTAEGVSEEMLGVAQTYPFNPWVQI